MIAVAVSGAAGHMGRLVSQAVQEADDLQLVAAYDPAGADGTSADAEVVRAAEVLVEFCSAPSAMENLARWRQYEVDCVVGTSGFDEARLAQVEELFDGGSRCLIVPNFSIGAVLMMRFAAAAAAHFAASEIIELHHDHKADAPSGTALATAARLEPGSQERAVESSEVIKGARGGVAAGVPIHSVRLPGLLAHQEVLLGNPGEVLTIRHDTTDRAAFLPGVLLAIRKVATLPAGLSVGLEAVL